jgi:hypothetical protein
MNQNWADQVAKFLSTVSYIGTGTKALVMATEEYGTRACRRLYFYTFTINLLYDATATEQKNTVHL